MMNPIPSSPPHRCSCADSCARAVLLARLCVGLALGITSAIKSDAECFLEALLGLVTALRQLAAQDSEARG
jgi:hypothetical protein